MVIESKRSQGLNLGSRFSHAWVIGTLSQARKRTKKVSYNPFKDRNFKSGNKAIKESKEAYFNTQGQVFI